MFEHLGYYKEYFINNKFIGTLPTEKDRDVIGFNGAVYEVIEQDILLSNNKKIKKGTSVKTFIYPLCGKQI
jgi:hypothetical protein